MASSAPLISKSGNSSGGLKGSPEPIAALNRVRISEYFLPFHDRESLVDVLTHCPHVSHSEHLCPYLRRTVADMLNAAQEALPSSHKFLVGTCLRTLTMQAHGWDNFHRKLREEHPKWPLSTLRRATNKYFAPYDQPAPPGHCTGGAVDVTLIGPDDKPLDVLGPTKGWEAAYTWSDKIGDAAKANRMIMVEAMLNAGFSNCRDEYWHYSYGDSGWAVRVGKNECPYGWIHPPVTADTNTEDGTGRVNSVHTIRDQEGRPVSAEAHVGGESKNSAEGEPKVRVRFNWAKAIPLTIHLPIQKRVSDFDPYYLGDGGEVWERIEEYYFEGDTVTLHVTPKTDRAVVSNFLMGKKPGIEETT